MADNILDLVKLASQGQIDTSENAHSSMDNLMFQNKLNELQKHSIGPAPSVKDFAGNVMSSPVEMLSNPAVFLASMMAGGPKSGKSLNEILKKVGKKASDIVKFNKAKVGKIKDIYKPTELKDVAIMKHSPKYKKDLKKMEGSDFHKSMKESEAYKQLFKNKEGGEDRFTEVLNWIMRDTKKTIR